MENEKRLRDIIRNAAPNDGLAFPHWFGNGWFVLIRKSKAILCHSVTYEARPGKFARIMDGPRNGATYADFAAAMGL